MPAPTADALSDEQTRALSEFMHARGYPARGPFVPLIRSPELLTRARKMGDYLRFRSPLRPNLRELAILITARKWSQPWQWAAHYTLAMESGVSPRVADAVGHGRRPRGMSRDEQAVYAFCTEMLDRGEVADSTYEAARSNFGEAMLVDLVGLVGYYTLLAMILNVARTPVPPDAPHVLPAHPSR
jgi:4-carboxymuconolactone decarboxylase